MHFSPLRRHILGGITASSLLLLCRPKLLWAEPSGSAGLSQLESQGLRLGVAALNTTTGKSVLHRSEERFPMCSTCKVLVCAAVLRKSMDDPALMQKHITYGEKDLLSWAPVTKQYLDTGMSVSALCGAAMQQSDNTATNLLIDLLGGPEAVTSYARSIGDRAFRLDRKEPELNSGIPGDERDTTTPLAMQTSLVTLLQGEALGLEQRKQLRVWLIGNTTGAQSIRAGIPEGWTVGDKTGNGDYGTTNDVGFFLTPSGQTIFLAVYLTQAGKDATLRKDILAEASGLVCDALAGEEAERARLCRPKG